MENTTPQSSDPKKNSNKTVIVIFVIVVVLIILGIVGSLLSGLFAKKVAEKGVESVLSKVTNGAVDIDTKNNSVTVKTDNGTTTTIGSQQLPSDFPTDIPVYPGATILGSVTGSATEGGVFVSLNTTDSMDDVKAFYDSKLAENGWTAEGTTTLGTIIHYSETKGSQRLAVTLTPYSDSEVHITLAESAK
jgi:hypothetical protein